MKHLAVLFIRFYRKIISPVKPSCCRFTPTCSAYALEAFQNRGFFIGFALTLRRILLCNPFARGGYDPVPYGGKWKRLDLFNRKTDENTGVTKNKRKVAMPAFRREFLRFEK